MNVRPGEAADDREVAGHRQSGGRLLRAAGHARIGGHGVASEDEEIVAGIKLLAESEGIFAETAGGVVIAGLQKLAREGKIGADELTVAYITGAGLKTQKRSRMRSRNRSASSRRWPRSRHRWRRASVYRRAGPAEALRCVPDTGARYPTVRLLTDGRRTARRDDRMAKQRVKFTFPQELITLPIIYDSASNSASLRMSGART